MADNELLQAIDAMFEKKLDEKLTPLKSEISSLGTEVTSLKTEVTSLRTGVGSLETEVSSLRTGVSSLETEVTSLDTEMHSKFNSLETEVRHTRVLIETDINKKIQIIAEQHCDIVDRLDALNDYPQTRGRVATLEHVAKSHTQDIEKLKKAVG